MTDVPRVDLDTARRFLACLAGDEPLCFQTFGDRKDEKAASDIDVLARHAYLPFATAERWLSEYNARFAGVFATVNRTDGKGRDVANIVALRALFIDVDGHEMPTAWPLEPSIIVRRSADRWHAYWLLVEGEPIERFTTAQAILAGHWLSDLKICDLPRVMRIPGFLHCKGEPRIVELLRADRDRRYTIDQVLQAHPVTWSSLPMPYQRKASRLGLHALPPEPERPRPAPAAPADDDEAWQIAAFKKWAGRIETSEGSANPNGGRDNSAFKIACEGHGRDLPRDVIEEVVLDYLHRARVANPEQDMRRLVGSACSQPREGHRPVRRSRSASAPTSAARESGPSFFDGEPPAAPPAAARAEPEEPTGPWDNLDVGRINGRWSIGTDGVAPIEWDSREKALTIRQNRRLGNLPLWPVRLGRDVATGQAYMQLGWITPAGETRRAWLLEKDVKSGSCLLDLDEGPIAGNRYDGAAKWLTEARPAIRNPMVEVTTKLGWCGINGSRRWVWPSADAGGVCYIGSDLPSHGDLDGWMIGLLHVLKLGQPGYVALVVAALSAAAPWARLLSGQRNPTLGLQARSSSGKGSVIDWALAIWCEASALTLPATSTAKGIQDRGIDVPDLPIFLDELQQLAESDPRGLGLSNAMYYLGNGQQRVRATKTGGAEGGARRFGVGFYAAEAPVLIGRNEGVALRAVELTGDPCPDEATARCLRAAGSHSGVLALQLSEIVRSRPVTDWARHLRERSAELARQHVGLRAGDSDVLALVERGCDAIAEACGLQDFEAEDGAAVPYPTDVVLAWLAAHIAEQRQHTSDRESVCLRETLDMLRNLDWGLRAGGFRESVDLQGRPLAWAKWGQQGRLERLDCDPAHPHLLPLFERAGGEDRVLRAWAEREWIERGSPTRLRVRRRGAGYVVRFTPAGLLRAGYGPESDDPGPPEGSAAAAPQTASQPAAAADDGEPPF